MVDLDDLVSARIIVARLGMLRIQDVHQARKRSDFPDPAIQLSRTSVWLWSEVRAWAVAAGWVGLADATPDTRRVMIEPADLVDARVIADRLDLELEPLNTALVDGLVPVESDQGGVLYRWSEAERLWHERANRSRSPGRRPNQ